MDIATAKRSGELARAIEVREPMLELIDRAIADGWRIKNVVAINPATGEEQSLVLDMLDAEISGMSLTFIRQIYVDQKTALEADLAAI